MKKLNNIVKAKSLHPTEFEGYTIRERLAKMGWEQLLNFDCDKIYRRVVIQWMASLSRNGDELTGIVYGKSYKITPVLIRDLLGVDTRTDLLYARFNKADFQAHTDENKRRWVEACKTVFGQEDAISGLRGYQSSKMTPVVKVLWRIGVWTFHPRLEDMGCVWAHEIYLLHALFTGDYVYSFAHLMINDIWDMYEDKNQQTIPHGYYISEILNRLGAVSEGEYVETVSLQNCLISRRSFHDLNFSESTTEYIINDRVTEQRVTFPKKVMEGDAPPQPPNHQMPVPKSNVDMTTLPVPNANMNMTKLLTHLQNVTIGQSSHCQEQHKELISVVSDIQKQLERQALDAEEREKRAEMWAHAIIWDLERQRYFYEQEQEQLRMAWNKVNGVNFDFQFPQMVCTSFHPPRVGCRYYDPTQGHVIPKAFQSLYGDIFGPRS